ncbi:VOC family protein [Roseobacter sp. HKCCA0434]|uniref:VOC family protein n=1 Tax=Roseobacter sp. HKCCA0434 TaxID=3079297 RepID=UPI0029058CC7|nr:VOC family protein [Roseobacter sp. HKCCA0434]
MQIDHLVFASSDLAAGRAAMEELLGVRAGGAGVHALMGTHNALWSLGGCYMEVIAIDPKAQPSRPRWFGLDDPAVRARLTSQPRLIHWQVRVGDIDAARAWMPQGTGPAIEVTRDDLSWRLTVREDGALSAGGAIPTLIEWGDPTRTPEKTLPDAGLRLDRLDVPGDPVERLADVPRVRYGAAALAAHVTTPAGPVLLT